MKKTDIGKLAGIIALVAIIGLVMAACGEPDTHDDTSGRLTITGLDAFNGKYVAANGQTLESNSLLAQGNLNLKSGWFTHGLISNGSVTLKVWKSSSRYYRNYKGNDTSDFHMEFYNEKNEGGISFAGRTLSKVQFTNGKGSVQYTNPLVGQWTDGGITITFDDPAFTMTGGTQVSGTYNFNYYESSDSYSVYLDADAVSGSGTTVFPDQSLSISGTLSGNNLTFSSGQNSITLTKQ